MLGREDAQPRFTDPPPTIGRFIEAPPALWTLGQGQPDARAHRR